VTRPSWIALGVLASACRTAPGNAGLGQSHGPAAINSALVEEMAVVATGAEPAPNTLRTVVDQLASGRTTVDAYVDSLVSDSRFAQDVAPLLLLNREARPPPALAMVVLKKKGLVYFLQKPCETEAAIVVRPWWAMDTEVRVCPDAYEPDHFTANDGLYCDGQIAAQRKLGRSASCGCGPNLMRCCRDDAQCDEFFASLLNESMRTIGHIVQNDIPIETAFTGNETFRDRNAEYTYQRWLVESREAKTLPDLSSWPKEGKWAPRHESTPGQMAGILTTPHILYATDGPRDRLRIIYDKVWCAKTGSSNVTTEGILGLGATDLRAGEGWRKLAAMPVCTNCHARMDYGMQFFSGYLPARTGQHFVAGLQTTEAGKLFGHDIHDFRGEAPSTPLSFAELAVKQPEFAHCMVQEVAEHVFGEKVSDGDVRAMRDDFRGHPTLKQLMRTALLRYASSQNKAMNQEQPGPSAFRPLLQANCLPCHGEGEGTRDFRAATLPQSTLHDMLSKVAFGFMPKDTLLETDERDRLVSSLVVGLWDDPTARSEAAQYFEGRMRALPVQRSQITLNVIRSRTATAHVPWDWSMVEDNLHADVQQYTPGFAAVTAIEALRDCKAATPREGSLEECLERSISPLGLVKGLGATETPSVGAAQR
jgi:hypothetical protein